MLTWEHCGRRVVRAVELVAKAISEAVKARGTLTLIDVLGVASSVVASEGYKPCIEVKDVRNYIDFLRGYMDGLARAVMNVGMEAVSRHLDRLGFNVYALLSATIMGYSLTEIQLITSFKQSLATMSVSELEQYEPLVFASILRFMGFSYFLSLVSYKAIKKRIKEIVGLAESFSREDQEIANVLVGWRDLWGVASV